jgi:hypothetical protein
MLHHSARVGHTHVVYTAPDQALDCRKAQSIHGISTVHATACIQASLLTVSIPGNLSSRCLSTLTSTDPVP